MCREEMQSLLYLNRRGYIYFVFDTCVYVCVCVSRFLYANARDFYTDRVYTARLILIAIIIIIVLLIFARVLGDAWS